MNTHCYTMVPGDASLVMVIQDRTHHKFMLFASHYENSKSPSTHTSKRGVRNPGNAVVLTELRYQVSLSSDSQFQGTRTTMRIKVVVMPFPLSLRDLSISGNS